VDTQLANTTQRIYLAHTNVNQNKLIYLLIYYISFIIMTNKLFLGWKGNISSYSGFWDTLGLTVAYGSGRMAPSKQSFLVITD
jgi:hypothetical protein